VVVVEEEVVEEQSLLAGHGVIARNSCGLRLIGMLSSKTL